MVTSLKFRVEVSAFGTNQRFRFITKTAWHEDIANDRQLIQSGISVLTIFIGQSSHTLIYERRQCCRLCRSCCRCLCRPSRGRCCWSRRGCCRCRFCRRWPSSCCSCPCCWFRSRLYCCWWSDWCRGCGSLFTFKLGESFQIAFGIHHSWCGVASTTRWHWLTNYIREKKKGYLMWIIEI